jgi:phenazine biosynthesis protein phzE
VFDDLFAAESFALIRMHGADAILLLAGPRTDVATLADIPLVTGDEDGDVWDSLVLVPFAQAQERGFVVREDGTPLSVLSAQVRREVPIDELLSALPDEAIEFTDRGGFETTDAEYAELVRHVIEDEVGQGEGANLVISRKYRARVADWSHDRALSVFRQLLERERGAYWTFCIFTGDRYLIGASPERHVSVSGGEVQMNPISGTIPLAGLVTREQREARLRNFLNDEKEIYELFMVVDEELKQMCQICHEGGQVLGPFLKPMSHLVHTEYRLIGRTREDVRQVLRDTMFAATVTGSPVENACRLIAQYEPHGRGYYASIAALIGRDSDGMPMADAPILIRTADVDLEGNLVVTAGATLVRDSDPAAETRETWAKASGILSAFGLVAAAPVVDEINDVATDQAIVAQLQSRNARLSEFWLTDQSGTAPTPQLAGRRVVVLDGEDDFVKMLGHIFSVMGMTTEVVRHDSYEAGCLDGFDLVVLGPGPGDPRDASDPKIAVFDDAVQGLLADGRPFLAVCLGHQVLSRHLGFDLDYKDIVFQGTQSTLPVLGRDETVGFYNTFVARVPASGLPEGLSVELDDASGDIHLVAGSHFRGIQFHAESILTQNGYDILRDLVTAVLD